MPRLGTNFNRETFLCTMEPDDHAKTLFVFDPFIFDSQTLVLANDGRLVTLQRQPARVLACLLERAGEVVTRTELQRLLWSDGTFVDFDRGLNYCVREVRRALGDSARNPRFIETLPRRGYRFVASVWAVSGASPRAGSRPRWRLALVALLVFSAGVGLGHETYPSALHEQVVSLLHGGDGTCSR